MRRNVSSCLKFVSREAGFSNCHVCCFHVQSLDWEGFDGQLAGPDFN